MVVHLNWKILCVSKTSLMGHDVVRFGLVSVLGSDKDDTGSSIHALDRSFRVKRCHRKTAHSDQGESKDLILLSLRIT